MSWLNEACNNLLTGFEDENKSAGPRPHGRSRPTHARGWSDEPAAGASVGRSRRRGVASKRSRPAGTAGCEGGRRLGAATRPTGAREPVGRARRRPDEGDVGGGLRQAAQEPTLAGRTERRRSRRSWEAGSHEAASDAEARAGYGRGGDPEPAWGGPALGRRGRRRARVVQATGAGTGCGCGGPGRDPRWRGAEAGAGPRRPAAAGVEAGRGSVGVGERGAVGPRGEESAWSRQAQGSADAGKRRRRRARVGWELARSRARWSAGTGGSGPLAGHGADAVGVGAGASAGEAWSRPATSKTRRGRSGGWAELAPRVATRQAAREAMSGAAGARAASLRGSLDEADEQQGRESEVGSPGQGAGAAEVAGRWSGAGPDVVQVAGARRPGALLRAGPNRGAGA
nr:fibroin heavy chain-like [Aegilops tauschii subsp. strangulata]